MSETVSEVCRRIGREHYNISIYWEIACPYKIEAHRQDYYEGWQEAHLQNTQSEAPNNFDVISESCPDHYRGKCVHKDVACIQQNCVPWYWRNI